MKLTVEQIAMVAHEVNKAYCESIGDMSQLDWANAPDWQQASAAQGVMFKVAEPNVTPEEMHSNWKAYKLAGGWKYGEIKDPVEKTHPCMVEYSELPPTQKSKDYIFQSIVVALGKIEL